MAVTVDPEATPSGGLERAETEAMVEEEIARMVAMEVQEAMPLAGAVTAVAAEMVALVVTADRADVEATP